MLEHPRVFISYSHQSIDYEKRVLVFKRYPLIF